MIINENNPYPLFKKGQQLKSGSLTGIVEFAEGEDWATRMYLEGSGIFYGLNIEVNPGAGTVKLLPGTAVTSDGYLFALEKEITYDGISKKEGKDFEIELFERPVTVKVLNNRNDNNRELIHRLSGVDPAEPPTKLPDDTTPYLIVLIVLDDETTVPSCLYGYENNESKKNKNIYPALIPKGFFKPGELEQWFIGSVADAGDKDPFVNRFGYTDKEQGGPHISFSRFTSWAPFSLGFEEVCKAAEPLIGEAYKAVYELVKSKLGLDTVNPFEELTGDLADLNKSVKSGGGRNYPWLYDYYRDLVAAYQEFVSTDMFSYLSYIPKKDRFPGYISLGSVRTGDNKLAYRMGLYRPPFADLSLNALEKPKLLMERMKYLADVEHTRFNETGFPPSGVLFTPDAGLNKQLSERAIPFYYKDPSALSQSWSAALTRSRRTFDIPGIDDVRDRKFLTTNMENYNFFRIKGHTGGDVEVTQTAIENQRRDLHLPFDIKFVYLGTDADMDPLVRQRSAAFSDLTILLEKIVNDIRCARTCSDDFERIIFRDGFDRDQIGNMFEALVSFFDKPPADLEEKLDQICNEDGVCNDENKTCCRAHLTSLYAVYKEYIGRKKELLDGLLFSRFAEKHPGLEHNGGVPKGGTLILLCTKNDVASLSEEKRSNLVNLLLSSKEEEKAAAISLAKELEGYNIVADFSLPYICCSGKPSINLVLQDAPPVARFDIAEQNELPEGEGVNVSLKNQSLRADTYHWELYDFKGEFITDKHTNDINEVVKFDLKRERGVVFAVLLTASRDGMDSKYSTEIVICPKGEVKVTSNGKDSVNLDITDSNEVEIEVTPFGGRFTLVLQQNDNQEDIDPSGFDIDWKEDKTKAVLTIYEPQPGIYTLEYVFNVKGCEGAGGRLEINAVTPTGKEPVVNKGLAPDESNKAVANNDAVLNKRILGYRGDVNKMAKEDETLLEDNRWTDTKAFLLASGTPETLHAGYEKLQANLQTGFSKLKVAQKAQVIKMLAYATAYYIDRLIVASPDKVPAIARKLVKAAAESISAQKDGVAQWHQVWNTTGIVTAENEKTVNTYKGLIA
ncbi:hypothetical protein [Chitinophaga sp. S165]|uniref:hypothetical protein n=1 Tax=Chitinophaga sp. S165 TaxID=2135462 RepID=UPI000D71C2AA|nr:hypothetical protein [Chitinophaga sp. S165]PWV56942.1 hypothetical protein C7475_1011462 [Chitinophaga sp. S165]